MFQIVLIEMNSLLSPKGWLEIQPRFLTTNKELNFFFLSPRKYFAKKIFLLIEGIYFTSLKMGSEWPK